MSGKVYFPILRMTGWDLSVECRLLFRKAETCWQNGVGIIYWTKKNIFFISFNTHSVPPTWTFEPQDTNVMLGNPISINCESSGYPRPSISWFKAKNKASKEYQAIPLKNNTLTVNFATTDDEGYYMCQASNEIGNGLKKIIHVNINEPARFDYASKNISSRRNDPVVLSCQARGDDPLTIAWSHNGIKIDRNNYRISIAEMKTDEGVNSQLSITRSDRHDSGTYKCIAENSFGRGEHLIYLAVQGKIERRKFCISFPSLR